MLGGGDDVKGDCDAEDCEGEERGDADVGMVEPGRFALDGKEADELPDKGDEAEDCDDVLCPVRDDAHARHDGVGYERQDGCDEGDERNLDGRRVCADIDERNGAAPEFESSSAAHGWRSVCVRVELRCERVLRGD